MNKQLTIEIDGKIHQGLQSRAEAAGLSIAEWITDLIERQIRPSEDSSTEEPSEIDREEAWQRIMSHAGSIKNGGSADNDSIDADLARAYANEL